MGAVRCRVLSKQPCTAPASHCRLAAALGANGKRGSQAPGSCCSLRFLLLLLLVCSGAQVPAEGRGEGRRSTHHENGCCEPGMAELAKKPAKICWMMLGREAGRAELSRQL